MASLIPGFEYDIFISYRQKDNKHDGWVTEFVEQLKGELEATFKEDISVYFDINPHDGLLETHDVDASLKSKLKCLVFIPIISRTYCDPQSFAWDHEFNAFVELASQDQFGLKVKLPNGNVTSRVLPVRIYDLDVSDIKLCESILGGVLRSVDFIYKSAGVNRPLRATEDHPRDNLNKTYYRDQLNKVANSIREIISAIGQNYPEQEDAPKATFKPVTVPRKKSKVPIMAGSVIVLALVLSGLFLIPKFFNSKETAEKSIAVLPFKLLSDEPDKQYLADGMMDAILLHLSKIRDLRVMPRTSVEQYRQTSKTIKTIGQELEVKYILEGSFQKYEDNVRLIVQLINASEESHQWANEYNKKWEEIFTVQSEVAQAIASEIKVAVSPQEKMIIESPPTSDLAAYDYYLRGEDYHKRSRKEVDFRSAIRMFEKAIEIDPDFALAWVGLAGSSRDLFWYYYDRSEKNSSLTKQYLDKAMALSPELKEVRLEQACYYYQCELDYPKSLELLERLKKEYPNDDEIYEWIGYVYRRMGEFSKALENINHAISLNPSDWSYYQIGAASTLEALREYSKVEKNIIKSIDLNPSNSGSYGYLFSFYCFSGQFQKARELLINQELSFESQAFKQYQAWLEYLERNYDKAIEITQSLSEDAISSQNGYYTKHMRLGLIYHAASNNNMAIRHFSIERDFLLKKISESENDDRLYSSLGIACAGLGMKEQALEAGKKALEILNSTRDTYAGYNREMDMVRILVMVGEYGEAMDKMDQIIKPNGSAVSVEILKLDPFWDPVRNNEKFKEIISNPDYQIRLNGD